MKLFNFKKYSFNFLNFKLIGVVVLGSIFMSGNSAYAMDCYGSMDKESEQDRVASFFKAVESVDLWTVRSLLSRDKSLVNKQTDNNDTALHLILKMYYYENEFYAKLNLKTMFSFLLQAGADITICGEGSKTVVELIDLLDLNVLELLLKSVTSLEQSNKQHAFVNDLLDLYGSKEDFKKEAPHGRCNGTPVVEKKEEQAENYSSSKTWLMGGGLLAATFLVWYLKSGDSDKKSGVNSGK